MTQMPGEPKGRFVQYPLHLIYGRKDLTRDDKWVLLAIMGSCWSEGPHRLSYREIEGLSGVPITLLTSYTDKKSGVHHEGVIDRLVRTGDIRIEQMKAINPLTGKPKGHLQTYIYINYKHLWQENVAYCDAKKSTTSEPYHVSEGEYQSVCIRNTFVSNTNTSDYDESTSVSNTNGTASTTNGSVSVSRLEVTPYITDQQIRSDQQKEREYVSVASANGHAPALSSTVLQQVAILPTQSEPENHSQPQPTTTKPQPSYSQHLEQPNNENKEEGHHDVRTSSGDSKHPGIDDRTSGSDAHRASGRSHPGDEAQEVTAQAELPAQSQGQAGKSAEVATRNTARGRRTRKETPAVQTETLLEVPLLEPDMSGTWTAEKVVQYAEWRNQKRYAEKMRDGQVKAARAFHQDDPGLTLEQFKLGYDDWFDWWQEHKGPLHVSDLRVKQKNGIVRLYSALEKIEAKKNRHLKVVPPPQPTIAASTLMPPLINRNREERRQELRKGIS